MALAMVSPRESPPSGMRYLEMISGDRGVEMVEMVVEEFDSEREFKERWAEKSKSSGRIRISFAPGGRFIGPLKKVGSVSSLGMDGFTPLAGAETEKPGKCERRNNVTRFMEINIMVNLGDQSQLNEVTGLIARSKGIYTNQPHAPRHSCTIRHHSIHAFNLSG